MRPLFTLLVLSLFSTGPAATAQDRYRGVLQLQSTDGTPLAVSIDGRRYERVGRRLLVGDLPTGRHRLRVYAVYAHRRDDGASGETIYRGVFYAEPGTIADCVVDVARGTARIRTLDATPRYSDGGRDPRLPVPAPMPGGAEAYDTAPAGTSGFLDDLRPRVAERVTDGDKLQTLKTALDRRTVRTDEVRTMLGWLSFDDTRLEFAKWAYSRVADRDAYWKLEDAFSFDSTKTDFNQYVRKGR